MAGLDLAVAPMHRICKKAGADRVSEEAARMLGRALDGLGVKIAEKAILGAVHAGRKTVKAKDITLAVEILFPNLYPLLKL